MRITEAKALGLYGEGRTREIDAVLPVVGTRRNTSCPDSAVVTTSTDGGYTGVYRKMSDYVVPDFYRRRAAGEVFNAPCDRVFATYSQQGKTMEFQNISKDYPTECGAGDGIYNVEIENYLPWLFGPPDYPPSGRIGSWPDLVAEASTKALSHVKQPDLQGMVSIAEYRETLRYLRDPFKALAKLADLYAGKLNPKRVKLSRRALVRARTDGDRRGKALATAGADSYLGFMYGLRPIWTDVEGAINAFWRAKVPERHTARGNVAHKETSVQVLVKQHGGDPLYAELTTTRTVEVSVRAGYLYAHKTRTNAENWGLNISQLPVAAYEAIPLSFVLDWFTGIGQMLNALTAAVTVPALAQWVSVKEIETVERVITDCYTTSGGPYDLELRSNPMGAKDKVVIERYHRVPVTLGFNVAPSFNVKLSAAKEVTILSLALQRLVK